MNATILLGDPGLDERAEGCADGNGCLALNLNEHLAMSLTTQPDNYRATGRNGNVAQRRSRAMMGRCR